MKRTDTFLFLIADLLSLIWWVASYIIPFQLPSSQSPSSGRRTMCARSHWLSLSRADSVLLYPMPNICLWVLGDWFSSCLLAVFKPDFPDFVWTLRKTVRLRLAQTLCVRYYFLLAPRQILLSVIPVSPLALGLHLNTTDQTSQLMQSQLVQSLFCQYILSIKLVLSFSWIIVNTILLTKLFQDFFLHDGMVTLVYFLLNYKMIFIHCG